MIEIKEITPIAIPGETSLLLSFPYNEEYISTIKSFSPVKYHKSLKSWEVPVTYLAELIDKFVIYDDVDIFLQDEVLYSPPQLSISDYKTKPYNYQLDGIKYGLVHDSWLLLDEAGLGKAVSLDTDVLTPNGFIPMRDIKVGDTLYDECGVECKVTNVYNHTNLKMYRITFTDGSFVDCCEDHLWRFSYEKCVHKTEHNTTTKRVDTVRDTKWLISHNWKRLKPVFPRCAPIPFTKKQLPIDPYILGCLLGDGCLTSGVGFTSCDDFIVNKIITNLPDELCLRHTNHKYGYTISRSDGTKSKNGNQIRNSLKALGLFGCDSHTKFIPDIYKLSSVEDRISLLCGLLDTDGYATSDNMLQFTTVSHRLFNDIVFLVESLGGMVQRSQKNSKYFNKKYDELRVTGVSYTGTIRIDDPSTLVSLPRKKKLLKPRKFLPRRMIKSIEPIDTHEGKCITVDSPNHLYVIKDFIVTHNTLQLIYLAQEHRKRDNIKHCLIICGVNTLKYNWKKEISKHSDLDCVILGERVNRNGKSVIGSINDRINHLKSDIKEFFILTNIETVRNQEISKLINDPKYQIDMIVIDEAHKIKDGSSQQGESVLSLTNAKYRVAATGTVLMNGSEDAYVPLQWTGHNHSTFTDFQKYYAIYQNKVLVGHKNLKVLRYQIAACSLRRTKDDVLDLPEKVIIPELVEMTPSQHSFYEHIKQGVADEVDKVKLKKTSLLSLITRLRQATELPSILTTENIGSSKIDRACDIAEELVDNDEKVIIFCSFKDATQELANRLSRYKPVVCTGDEKDEKVSEYIDRFQTDDSCKVLIATWQKIGVGLTLTVASHVIFISTPWTNADFSQACDRVHRIGAKNTVFIHNLINVDTIDERVWSLINEKKALSDYVVDSVEDDSVMSILWQYLIDLK